MKNGTFHHIFPNCGTVTLEQDFSQTCRLCQNVPPIMPFDFKAFREKINDEIFRKI